MEIREFCEKSSVDSLGERLEQKPLQLLMGDKIIHELDPATVEPLSQETFTSLISLYSSSNKSFILSLVRNRDLDNLSDFFYFCFHAYELNKLLFRTKASREIYSRHDKKRPFSVCNPLTNLPIVGEVEYFKMTSSTTAQFIGTDYTYTQLDSLRDIFKNNALRTEDLQFREQALLIADLPRMPNLDASDIAMLEREIENHRMAVMSEIRVPFKKAAIFGGIAIIYVISIVACLMISGEKVWDI